MGKGKTIKEMDDKDIVDKYRELTRLISAVERMPKQINACKLKAPPHVPKEFRKSKIPSNLFFVDYEFTMLDIIKHVAELREIYGREMPDKEKRTIDKGDD